MKVHLGEIVYVSAGRDAGKYFIVLSAKDGYLHLCDGKGRKTDSLKKKNVKHVLFTGVWDEEIQDKLKRGEEVTNRQVRESVSKYKGCCTEIIIKQ